MRHSNQKSYFGKKDSSRHEGRGATGTGHGSFGGKISRDDRGFDQEKRMHRAVCSECGTDCQVPFRPIAERPVFCSNCFEKMAAAESPRRDQFKPNRFAGPKKPGSFRRSEPAGAGDSDDLKKELAQIHQKLDWILSALKRR